MDSHSKFHTKDIRVPVTENVLAQLPKDTYKEKVFHYIESIQPKLGDNDTEVIEKNERLKEQEITTGNEKFSESNNSGNRSSSELISASVSSTSFQYQGLINEQTPIKAVQSGTVEESDSKIGCITSPFSDISSQIGVIPQIIYTQLPPLKPTGINILQDVIICEAKKYVNRNDSIENTDGDIKCTTQITNASLLKNESSPVITEFFDEYTEDAKSNNSPMNSQEKQDYPTSNDGDESDDTHDKNYLPPSDYSSSQFSEENLSMSHVPLTKVSKESVQVIHDVPVPNVKNPSTNGNSYEICSKDDNRDLCTFCFEEVGHFSRHLLRKHSQEEKVKKILKMPLKSNDRRLAIAALRKKGNFLLKQERNVLKPARRDFSSYGGNKDKNYEDNYVPCKDCLGYFKKKYLWRHHKICKSKCSTSKSGARKQHLSEIQTFLAATGLLGNFLNKSRVKTEVFDIMRPDDISSVAKNDPLICLYGESYINKHKRKQMNIVVSNKMREMARLKIALKNFSTIQMLVDILKPEMYEHIVAASKIISGYDSETRTFKASSLALHMGTNLTFLCDVARKALMVKDPLLAHMNREESLKNIMELREMIKNHWCNDVSSLANKVLNENKWEKPKLLPVTEDVLAFNTHVTNLAKKAFEKLRKKENISENYKLLCECTLSIVLVFNRKRIGEVQFLTIKSYKKNVININQEELLNSLSELEKVMSATFKHIIVFGKGSKPIPILFTKRMQVFIDLLLEVRKTTDIVPASNPYIFANPRSIDRWMTGPSVIRKFAFKCGAKTPELLTSTRFRKQISTILQIMNLEKDEMEQIARFMGHTEKTHREFYRLTEDVYQTAKVVKVLLLLNKGKGSEFKGKSLSDIPITEDFIEEDDDNDITEEIVVNKKKLKISPKKDADKSADSNEILSNFDEHCASLNKNSNSCPQKKKGGRHRWSDEEKKIVLNFFKKNLRTKTPPKKDECLTFIREHSDIFRNDDWVRIKTLVYNTYRNKN